jgi:uncharacterized protein DUF6582
MNGSRFGILGMAQFTKLNATTGEFVGVMTSETPDEDREIMDFEQSRPYFEEWSELAYKRSQGKSYGNVREMHGLSAAGILTRPLIFDEKAKKVWCHGLIVDPLALRKANTGVYIGLSIGGRYVDRYPDPDQPGYVRYIADLTELSLVDSPNNPDATMELIGPTGKARMVKIGAPASFLELPAPERFELGEDYTERLLKMSGAMIADRIAPSLRKEAKTKRVGGKELPASAFAFVGNPDLTETWKYPIHDAAHVRNALSRWGSEKGIPADQKAKVYARIKAAAKKFGVEVSDDTEKVVKSLYDVGGVAQALQNLEYIRSCLSREAEIEGDGSEVPAKLRETMANLGDVLKELVAEETDELLALSAAADEGD